MSDAFSRMAMASAPAAPLRTATPSGVPVDSSGAAFDDPEDQLRWSLVHSLHASLDEMMSVNEQCCEKVESVEKAYAVAEMDYVNGIRQAEASKNTFRNHGRSEEQHLVALLGRLREVTLASQQQWADLLFLLPGADHDVVRISNWCRSHGVETSVFSEIIANSMFINTDYGLTRESFWAEDQRVAAAMRSAGR